MDKVVNMSKFSTKLIEADESQIIKRSTISNFVASMINASYSAVMLFFITRIVGVEAGGMFSIAMAYAYQCQTLGAFGVRNVHASDTNNEYSFSDYFYLRVFSCILMYGLIIYYAFASNYDLEKSLVVFSIGIFKSVEAIEDLYHGEYHRFNRLDIGSILQTIRYVISVVVLLVLLIITRDLVISNLVATIVTIIIFIFQNRPYIKYYIKEKIKFNYKKVKKLFIIVLPICISGFISAYIVNVPKYTIDSYLSQSIQTYYGILMMPVQVINMLSVVVYRPMINPLSVAYNSNDNKTFVGIITKQVLLIIILTFIAVIGGYIIGLKLLGIIYSVDLSSYMLPFIILIFGGGLNTIAGFFMVVLTVQRSQNQLLIGYVITLIVSLVLSTSLVSNLGITGASLLYTISSGIMVIIFSILVVFEKIKSDKLRG